MKRAPSTKTILFGGLGLFLAVGLIFFFLMKYLLKTFDSTTLLIAFGVILIIMALYERRQKSKQKRVQNLILDKTQLINIDWSGEENEGEIQNFIETANQQTITWTKVNDLREKQNIALNSPDKFLIKLLKAIDADIKQIDRRLLFLKTDGDNYLFTSVDEPTYRRALTQSKEEFFGIDKL
ncbi:hypothetical protein WSM22_32940 [Cytophagales bacterium WSM2-2]|nr:hypothetical protein WSM22_32940 [Cytophagales bacterium WSM2-2]